MIILLSVFPPPDEIQLWNFMMEPPFYYVNRMFPYLDGFTAWSLMFPRVPVDGFYMLPHGLSLSQYLIQYSVYIISLTLTGVSAIDVFDLIMSEIIEGMIFGFALHWHQWCSIKICLEVTGFFRDYSATGECLNFRNILTGSHSHTFHFGV